MSMSQNDIEMLLNFNFDDEKDETIKKDDLTDDDIIVKKIDLPEPSNTENKSLNEISNIVNENINEKIDKGVFPFPAEPETKVVNQLSEVANDSEEKVSLIFDYLSSLNQENYRIISINENNISFLNKQEKTFLILKEKFPNIKIFDKTLKEILEQKNNNEKINKMLEEQNTKIFQAMELMQFNDINRQKIERVMSVIKKLNSYLNNIFEDEKQNNEIVTAKYIHGDNKNDIVNEDDIENIIKEYNL